MDHLLGNLCNMLEQKLARYSFYSGVCYHFAKMNFQGVLVDGQEIAVNIFSQSFGQGLKEFKSEF